MEDDEITLLREELGQLSVKSSLVSPPNDKTLIGLLWKKKPYNLISFRAQMKAIWKVRKKFDLQLAGQNLLFVVFYEEDDLKFVLEGRPWLFRKKLIILDRLKESISRQN